MGAGASFGSGHCSPRCPPLGKELFAELVKLGGVASRIPSPISDTFLRDFEAGMAEYAEQPMVELNPLLREMSRYFLQFGLESGNAYHVLLSGTRKSNKAVSIATTNYEMLIENAVVEAGLALRMPGAPPSPGHVPVLKIHGSIHILPEIRFFKDGGMHMTGGSSYIDGPTRYAKSSEEIKEFLQQYPSFAPSIALYAPGKRVMNAPRHITEIQEQFRLRAREAELIVIIGLRVLAEDDHIWGTIAAAAGHVAYVGGEQNEFREWARSVGKHDVEILGSRFGDALPAILRAVATT